MRCRCRSRSARPPCLRAQRAQRVRATGPTGLLRLVRIDRRRRRRSLPVRSTTATFTPVRRPGSRPSTALRSGGRGEQQVLEVVAEHLDRLGFGLLARLRRTGRAAGAGAASRATSGGRCRAATGRRRGPALCDADVHARRGLRAQQVPGVRHRRRDRRSRYRTSSRRARNSASKRCDGILASGFGVIEVVAVLRAFGLPCLRPRARGSRRSRAARSRSSPTQRGVFAPALHQDRARAVERGLGVGDALLGIDEARRRTSSGACVGSREQRRRPAARGRPRARSAPWCGAWACTAGTGLPGAPCCRRPRSRRAARR